MRFLIYDAASGAILREIIRTAGSPDVPTGQAVIPTPDGFTGNDTTHEVVDGEVVEIS
jgi:hypothetical protein